MFQKRKKKPWKNCIFRIVSDNYIYTTYEIIFLCRNIQAIQWLLEKKFAC